MTKKPVYQLKPGDIFLAEDRQTWTVEELVKPQDEVCLSQIGENPRAYTIVAKRASRLRKFYHYGSKLLLCK